MAKSRTKHGFEFMLTPVDHRALDMVQTENNGRMKGASEARSRRIERRVRERATASNRQSFENSQETSTRRRRVKKQVGGGSAYHSFAK